MSVINPSARVAARAAADPFFVAFVLAEYAAAEGLDTAALAARLGCTVEVLAHVGLCRTPPVDPDGFRTAISRISEKFGVLPQPLGVAVRLGQAVADRTDKSEAPAEAGYILAARDRPPQ